MCNGDMVGLALVKFSGSLVIQGNINDSITKVIRIMALRESFEVKNLSNLILIILSKVLVGDEEPVSCREKR